jgi:hypothetical protein
LAYFCAAIFLPYTIGLGVKYPAMQYHQYYILNRDPRAEELFEFLGQHQLRCEVHLNRTRFWVPEGSIFTEFALRFSLSCPPVDLHADLGSGLPDYEQ